MISALLDFISPRGCRMCGNRLALTENEICTVCNWQLPRTDHPTTPYDNPMARLFWGRFPLEKAAAWMYYQPSNPQCKLVYDIKYYGQDELAFYLGQLVAREFQAHDFFDDIDMIVPMPLTFLRRLKRGYNQAERIARGVSDVTGIPVAKPVKRVKFVNSQTRLSSFERAENVKDAFRLKAPEALNGKHILIVDDVVTTGATVSSCAMELCKAGDMKVSILSLGFTK